LGYKKEAEERFKGLASLETNNREILLSLKMKEDGKQTNIKALSN
jgi:hypothetical protein